MTAKPRSSSAVTAATAGAALVPSRPRRLLAAAATLLLLTSAPTPALAAISYHPIAYDMVSSTSLNLLDYTNPWTDAFASRNDGFQKYKRGGLDGDGNEQYIPDALDDVTNPNDPTITDTVGIIKYDDFDEFFGAVDSINPNSEAVTNITKPALSASWYFDVSSHSDYAVSIDMAGVGDFEGSDNFQVSASVDTGDGSGFGPEVVIFQGVCHTSGNSHPYTLADGTQITLDDPMRVFYDTADLTKHVFLNNDFQTVTTVGTSFSYPGTAEVLKLTLTAMTNGNVEALAFRNIVVLADDGTTAEPTAHPSERPSAKPSAHPSAAPTSSPSASPSAAPTGRPSAHPSGRPSASPTSAPTPSPSVHPSANPTSAPSASPTSTPSAHPSSSPTAHPSFRPSRGPTATPTHAPTISFMPTVSLIDCPPPGESKEISVGMDEGRPLELGSSGGGTLCTLTRVTTPTTGGANSRDVVIPIARSYEGHPWESAAGSFAIDAFAHKSITCPVESCLLTLPPHESANSKYVLTSYSRPVVPSGPGFTQRDEVARFLELTTFGQTKALIDAYDVGAFGEAERAAFVEDQMNVGMTSHREFWRRRTNPKLTHSAQPGRTDHPCSPSSRWRTYALIRHDRRYLSTTNDNRKAYIEYPPTNDTYPPITLYEAEDAAWDGGSLRSSSSGFSGTGYIDFWSSAGKYIEFTESNVPETKTYFISFRYANSGTLDRPLKVIVNGEVVNPSLSFPSTGAWNRWRHTDYVEVTLDANIANTIRIETLSWATPNVDHMRVGRVPPAVLKIDGHARTVLPMGLSSQETYSAGQDFATEDYGYQICDWPHSPNVRHPNGRMKLKDGTGDCVYVDTMNPTITFTGFEQYVPGAVFDLSSNTDDAAVWTPYSDEQGYYRTEPGRDYLLSNGITDNPLLCSAVPNRAEEGDAPVLARLPDGTWLQWTPQLVLEENTPGSPVQDGGGAIHLATEGETICMNAPRNFLNEKDCVLSTSDVACTTDEAPSEVEIVMNEQNIRKLHELTGRYVYAIKGLYFENGDHQTMSPCIHDLVSRWEKTEGNCTAPTDLGSTTWSILEGMLLAYDDGEEANPYVIDAKFPAASSGYNCDGTDVDKMGIQIQIGTTCYTHVHPEHLNVYDVTGWADMDAHPGNKIAANQGNPHPIEKWADTSLGYPGWYLEYPNWHPMSRWDMHSVEPNFLTVRPGGIARFGDAVSFRDLSEELKQASVAEHFGGVSGAASAGGTVVCGSTGEVGNDRLAGAWFDSENTDDDTTFSDDNNQQKATVWAHASLWGEDQLRQRVAWALSQILVVVPAGVNRFDHTEIFLNFYDIFVRNAFGSYLNILREISYSPLMAEHLTYLASKSHAYIFQDEDKRVAFADENFAREILQLFSTGLIALNLDGTPKLDVNNKTVQVYDNEDMMSFARAWTGFQRHRVRGNIELDQTCSSCNRMDPMRIEQDWRDRFPKSDLLNGYIGDKYPLCVDLPDKMFLRKGAKYRILGSSPLPELIEDHYQHFRTDSAYEIKRLELDSSSSELYARLHDSGNYPAIVVLDSALSCFGEECLIDAPRVVKVGMYYYEYVRPPCVEQAFYNNGKAVGRQYRSSEGVMCANPELPYASEACCSDLDAVNAHRNYTFDGERVTYKTAEERCGSAGMCVYRKVDLPLIHTGYHWTPDPCHIYAKINSEGYVAIVHDMDNMKTIPLHVSEESLNYFKVYWAGDDYPKKSSNNCGDCQITDDGACLCQTEVVDEPVFSFSDRATITKESLLSSLSIGHMNPNVYDANTFIKDIVEDVFVAHTETAGVYDSTTVFEVTDGVGRKHFLKNVKSTVYLKGWTLQQPMIYEAEDASSYGTDFQTRDSSIRHTGAGWLDYSSSYDSYIEWNVTVPSAGIYRLKFRYALKTGNRPLSVTVNNQQPPAEPSLDFKSTGDWNYWRYSPPVDVALQAGTVNTIRLQATGDSGGDVDHLLIEGLPTSSSYAFPNAPHFMGLLQDYSNDGIGETNVRDAQYETEAVLEHYFYHDNVAPFICTRLIQRFGVSNPSPRYVKECSLAFRSGAYSSGGKSFGQGQYGDLGAAVAAIALDREAASAVLDLDPGHGSLREPIMKVIGLMRSMDYAPVPGENLVQLWFMHNRIGQAAHEFPTVFSFFLPEYVPDVGPTVPASYVAPEAMAIDMPNAVELLNGMMSMVKYGLSDCLDDSGLDYGFAKYPGYGSCSDDGQFERSIGTLEYVPSGTTTAEIVDDLATMLTAGRLSERSRNIIIAAYDAHNGDAASKRRLAQQLILTSAEFHSTNPVKPASDSSRNPPPAQTASSGGNYKAIVFLIFDGGCDSFNMLTPYTCDMDSNTNLTVFEKYENIRENVALKKTGVEALIEIPADIAGDNPDQPCDSFGLNSRLPFLEQLYNQGDAVFVANAGLLAKPVTKDDYKVETPIQLFAHNTMQRGSKTLDAYEEARGTGVLGRTNDVLNRNGISAGAYSIQGNQIALIGEPDVSPAPVVLSNKGLKDFDPASSTPNMKELICSINNATAPDSGFMGETWSHQITGILEQHEDLYAALSSATVTANFPDNGLADQLKVVTQLMQSHAERGMDRDVFYVSMGGFDTHARVIDDLQSNFDNVNAALEAFVTELDQVLGLWDSTTLVQFSDFGRTLIPNSGPAGDGTGAGSDHGWGGNTFVMGGGLAGGKVLGKYPDDFTEEGSDIMLSKGRIVPTTPWDATWNAVCQWFGVDEADMDEVLPMRSNFQADGLLFEKADLYAA